ncbi:Phosphatidyl-myo-inositol mannosyltransferase [Thermoflexales bacterium]|nr:Phosphatidyl-myo-inositol mannosyltransferase [Thermoflexales bacterium]
MRAGLIIYGSLDTVSGGYLYDCQLVEYLRGCGDTVEIFSLPWRNYPRHLLDNFSNALYRRVRATELDVLLEDELNHPSVLRLNRQLRGQVRYPIVSIVHHLRGCETHASILRAGYRWIERHYLASVDGFICNSETTRRTIAAALQRAELARSVVVPPAGDRFASTITPEIIEQRAHEAGPLRLVFVGNVIPRKRLLVLLEALLQLPTGLCQLTVVGNTDLDELHMRVVNHLFMVTSLSGVTLTGAISDAELAAILAHSQVLVVPSDYEGFGIVYLEGMGFGLPAIGTTSGAAKEIITDGLNGYLIPPNDPVVLAKCLATLVSDRDKLAHLSLAAHERFLAQPSWNDSLARIRQVLLQWISDPTSQG